MPGRPALLINAAELLRVPGNRRRLDTEVEAVDVDATHPSVDGPIAVGLDLESSVDHVAVTGTLTVPWRGVCRRCARPLTEAVELDIDERYGEPPTDDTRRLDDDVLPIVRGQFDLAPMVRDETLLVAATDRLCRPDCAGLCPTCGADLNEGDCGCVSEPADDRWTALEALRADGDGSPPR